MAPYISSNEREEPTTKNTLPARLRFRFDRDVKSFTKKQNLRAFSTTRPALQIMLKELLGGKEKPTTRNRKVTNGKAHQ